MFTFLLIFPYCLYFSEVCACIHLLPVYQGLIFIVKKCRGNNLTVNILGIFYMQILMTKFENCLFFSVSFYVFPH